MEKANVDRSAPSLVEVIADKADPIIIMFLIETLDCTNPAPVTDKIYIEPILASPYMEAPDPM